MPMCSTRNARDLKSAGGSLCLKLWRNYVKVKLLQVWVSAEMCQAIKSDYIGAIAKLCCAKERVTKQQTNVFHVTNMSVEHAHKTSSVFVGNVILYEPNFNKFFSKDFFEFPFIWVYI